MKNLLIIGKPQSRTYQRFVKKLGKTSYLVDDERIATEAQRGGLRGVIAHLPDSTDT